MILRRICRPSALLLVANSSSPYLNLSNTYSEGFSLSESLENFNQWFDSVKDSECPDPRPFSFAHNTETSELISNISPKSSIQEQIEYLRRMYRKRGWGMTPDSLAWLMDRALHTRNFQLGNALWNLVITEWQLGGPRAHFVMAMACLLCEFLALPAGTRVPTTPEPQPRTPTASESDTGATDTSEPPHTTHTTDATTDTNTNTQHTPSEKTITDRDRAKAGSLAVALVRRVVDDGSLPNAPMPLYRRVCVLLARHHADLHPHCWYEVQTLFEAINSFHIRTGLGASTRARHIPPAALSWLASAAESPKGPRQTPAAPGTDTGHARPRTPRGIELNDEQERTADGPLDFGIYPLPGMVADMKRLVRSSAMARGARGFGAGLTRLPYALVFTLSEEAALVREAQHHEIVLRRIAAKYYRSKELFLWLEWFAREMRPLKFSPVVTITPSNLWPEYPHPVPEGEQPHRALPTLGPIHAPYLTRSVAPGGEPWGGAGDTPASSAFGAETRNLPPSGPVGPPEPLALPPPVEEWHRTTPITMLAFDPDLDPRSREAYLRDVRRERYQLRVRYAAAARSGYFNAQRLEARRREQDEVLQRNLRGEK